jgi:site-specific DNA-methyltransferase (adenine-specific)
MIPLPQLLQGDCIDALSRISDDIVDLVVTDPPYVAHYRDRSGRRVARDNRADWILPAFDQIGRVMRQDSLCVSFYGWTAIAEFMAAWKAAGLKPVGHLVWHKSYASRVGFVAARHEQGFLLAKGNPPRPAKALPDVLPWKYTGNQLHLTQKAVEVIQPLIEAFSRPGDLVLDPFMGSGTTGVAAAQAGRRFIGIELDPVHFETARARVLRPWGLPPDPAANDNETLVYANGALA